MEHPDYPGPAAPVNFSKEPAEPEDRTQVPDCLPDHLDEEVVVQAVSTVAAQLVAAADQRKLGSDNRQPGMGVVVVPSLVVVVVEIEGSAVLAELGNFVFVV